MKRIIALAALAVGCSSSATPGAETGLFDNRALGRDRERALCAFLPEPAVTFDPICRQILCGSERSLGELAKGARLGRLPATLEGNPVGGLHGSVCDRCTGLARDRSALIPRCRGSGGHEPGLLFQRNIHNIARIAFNGTRLTLLGAGPNRDSDPTDVGASGSPRGDAVAFCRQAIGEFSKPPGLWTMDLNGDNAQVVVGPEPPGCIHTRWQSSRTILFLRTDGIWSVDRDGANLTHRIVGNDIDSFDILSDSEVVLRHADHYGVRAMDGSGTERTVLARPVGVFGGAVSPKRDLFAIARSVAPDASGSDGMIRLVDTSTWRVIREIGPYAINSQPRVERVFTFSPDQSRLYFKVHKPHRWGDLVSVSAADGSDLRMVTNDEDPDAEPILF